MNKKKSSSKSAVGLTIEETLAEINQTYGTNTAYEFGSMKVDRTVQSVPTGSLALDRATGIFGIPCGRIIEIFGPESSGKTTLALHMLQNAMLKFPDKRVMYIDIEHAIDKKYATTIVPKFSDVIFSQPDSAEAALEITERITKTGQASLIVIDSVAAMTPEAELEKHFGESNMGLHARLMSQACRKLVGLTYKTNTILIFINQIRSKIGIVYGNPETTTGGRALKFYSSMRFDIRSAGKVEGTDGETAANTTKVKIVKNKLGPPFREAEFMIRFGEGIDLLTELTNEAVERGVIKKAGASYQFKNKTLAVGAEKMRLWLKAHPQFATALQAKLQSLFEKEISAGTEEDVNE